ncbi:hypothetical protein SAMN05192574_105350 [Mucilaginibacter gossypiicola]|uniref:Uncharacterized protein n=1 Tax=Mucilaginibacter gossypiicola TaxID=551995 RepID=A0A1H8M1Z3_9SPHI|nr:hypothetical protein SAMN05192574_105350 [Mucilaginibacter gossypiicola]
MTVRDFQAMDELGQGKALLKGTFLESRKEVGYKVSLYAVGNIYVEVFYSEVLNEIFQLVPFSSVTKLEPYLNNLKLENL